MLQCNNTLGTESQALMHKQSPFCVCFENSISDLLEQQQAQLSDSTALARFSQES